MREIHALAKTKTVILISHRLANVVSADNIYVLDKGNVVECGDHNTLLSSSGAYAKLWNAQQELESYNHSVIARSEATRQSPGSKEIATPVCALVRNDAKKGGAAE